MSRKQLIDLAASQVALEYVLTKHAGHDVSNIDWRTSVRKTAYSLMGPDYNPAYALAGAGGGAVLGGLGGAAYEGLFGDADNSQYAKRMLQGAGLGGAVGGVGGHLYGLGNSHDRQMYQKDYRLKFLASENEKLDKQKQEAIAEVDKVRPYGGEVDLLARERDQLEELLLKHNINPYPK